MLAIGPVGIAGSVGALTGSAGKLHNSVGVKFDSLTQVTGSELVLNLVCTS